MPRGHVLSHLEHPGHMAICLDGTYRLSREKYTLLSLGILHKSYVSSKDNNLVGDGGKVGPAETVSF